MRDSIALTLVAALSGAVMVRVISVRPRVISTRW